MCMEQELAHHRAPTRALNGKTPYEAWHGTKPNMSHLREFRCDVWVLDESKNRTKLDRKSKKMILVGFMDGSKSIRYYDAKTRSIKVSRNVAFNENDEPKELEDIAKIPGLQAEGERSDNSSSQTKPEIQSTPPKNPETIPNITEAPELPRLRSRTTLIDYRKMDNPKSKLPSIRHTSQSPISSPNITEASNTKNRNQEQTNFTMEQLYEKIFKDIQEYSFSTSDQDDPKTVEEALSGPDAEKWKEAMETEMGTINKMGTWKLEELPKERETIGNKWVFIRKRDEKGNIIRYKARLIAQGFSQKPGTDYSNDGTFAPVMRFETLRTLLALGAVNNWKIRQFDIKGAYLHGTLHETIYMRQPEGFNDESGRVCQLIRPLYGLKQSGNVWNKEFTSTMKSLGFTQLKTDYCCFI